MAQQPQAQKGVAYTVVFPILDASGDLVPNAAGLDSEISKDLGAFQDCSNEAVELATNSGVYSLTLTVAEMTADIVAIIVKSSTSGAKTTPIALYPEDVAVTRNAVADAILGRAISNVEGTATFRSLAGAIAKMVNRVRIVGTSLKVYKTNDTDEMGSQEITTDAAANPIVEVNTD